MPLNSWLRFDRTPEWPYIRAQQAVADAQANRWIERELIKLLRGRTPFDGHQPSIGYRKRDGAALLVHGGTRR